ncbi:MAG TPA: DUF479 domain-containing protein [Marinilabiliaceae bacterium]|nr:DUF479 domain-containing protein [Marinilabiliaceae bacterium]
MNYLSHLFLSGSSEGVKVGNFIGDFVKGSRHNRYAPEIQKGILLHRQIDSFMDSHPVTKASSELFRSRYRRYAKVLIDIVYDHFLAVNWELYREQSLHQFVSESHNILLRHYFIMPGPVKQFLPFLIRSRRMENYRLLSGIERTLKIMSENSSMPEHSEWAIAQIKEHYDTIDSQFKVFFEDIMAMSAKFIDEYPKDELGV